MKTLDELIRDGKTDELNLIRKNAPLAIPGPAMRTLWRLLLAGRVKSSLPALDLHDWLSPFERHGLTPVLRLELRDMLTPRVHLRPPIDWDDAPTPPDEEKHGGTFVESEIVLSSDNVDNVLDELRQDPRWSEALPDLLEDFSALLIDAMDLARELGKAEPMVDHSYVDQPSISDHP